MNFTKTACLALALTLGLATSSFGASRARLLVGAGIAASGGSTGAHLNFGIRTAVETSVPLTLGVDSGLIVLGSEGIPLLAAGEVYFSELDSDGIYPYFGVSVGPVVGMAGTPLAIFLRPGLDIPLSGAMDLNVQAAIGSLGGAFYIAPIASLIIPI